MLYRFKSKAGADVVMLEPAGKRLLEILGKDPAGPGILLPQDMPQAAESLLAAVLADDQMREKARLADAARDAHLDTPDAQSPWLDDNTAPKPDVVTLRMRVAPFLALLGHSMRENTPVMWGV